jgi:hypothetical protein
VNIPSFISEIEGINPASTNEKVLAEQDTAFIERMACLLPFGLK